MTANPFEVLLMKLRPKYPKSLEYTARSSWDGLTGCTAYVTDNRKVVIDTPSTYGGKGDGICPDELFVASVLGCLNNTFLDFQRRFEMQLVAIDLSGKAIGEFDGEGYKITGVSIWGEIVVGEDELEAGERCLHLMKKFCHLTRTINGCIPIDYDVSVREE
jgi:organic hydroperoxide reductase OsmC/OhrA